MSEGLVSKVVDEKGDGLLFCEFSGSSTDWVLVPYPKGLRVVVL